MSFSAWIVCSPGYAHRRCQQATYRTVLYSNSMDWPQVAHRVHSTESVFLGHAWQLYSTLTKNTAELYLERRTMYVEIHDHDIKVSNEQQAGMEGV